VARLLLFDIDGTLLNTAGAGRSALGRAMLEVFGETGPLDDFEFDGRTDPAIVRGLLRSNGRDDGWIDARVEGLWGRYCEELDGELARRDGEVAACAGVPDLLNALTAREDVTLGLVTGNVEGGAWRKLRACGLEGHFRFGAFGSDSELREELPPIAVARAGSGSGRRFGIEDCLVIGDTPEDIRCARACGARVLAVATGRYGLDELRTHGPDAALPDLAGERVVLDILGNA